MSLPNFSTSTKWLLLLKIIDNTGGADFLEFTLRNVTDLASAQAAADSVIDKLEALTAGVIARARLAQEITDSAAPDSESAITEQIKIWFSLADSSLSSTTVPAPKAGTASGTLVDGSGNVNQTNSELDAWRQEFLSAGGHLTLNGETPTQHQFGAFQSRSGAIR